MKIYYCISAVTLDLEASAVLQSCTDRFTLCPTTAFCTVQSDQTSFLPGYKLIKYEDKMVLINAAGQERNYTSLMTGRTPFWSSRQGLAKNPSHKIAIMIANGVDTCCIWQQRGNSGEVVYAQVDSECQHAARDEQEIHTADQSKLLIRRNHPQESESTVNFRSDCLVRFLSSSGLDAVWLRPSIRPGFRIRGSFDPRMNSSMLAGIISTIQHVSV
jgi:hypothetical protein